MQGNLSVPRRWADTCPQARASTLQRLCRTFLLHSPGLVCIAHPNPAALSAPSPHSQAACKHTGSEVSPVSPGTGDPLGRDFADEETIAGAADVLLPCWGVLNGLQRETNAQEGDKKTEGQRRRAAGKTLIAAEGRKRSSVIRDVFREESRGSGENGASIIISMNVLLVLPDRAPGSCSSHRNYHCNCANQPPNTQTPALLLSRHESSRFR